MAPEHGIRGPDRVDRVDRVDDVVVGVGVMGAAACYELARRGRRVLGIDRGDVPNAAGSSRGRSRIIRLPYYEDPVYVPLVRRALDRWRALDARAGGGLLRTTGSVDAGPPGSWVAAGARRSAEAFDLPHEVLDARELRRRFPGYRLPADFVAVYQPDGGVLDAEGCVLALARGARIRGAVIRPRQRVLGWEPGPDGVRVHTDAGAVSADRLVVTAGPWIRAILPELDRLAVPERQVVAWFAPRRPGWFGPDRFPVANVLFEEGRHYALPSLAGSGLKIGLYHHRGEQGDPSALLTAPDAVDEDLLARAVARYFPEAHGPARAMQTCLFTNTPDSHFLVDHHPDHPQVVLASACSGHGFKFAPAIGELLADLADGVDRPDAAAFRLGRFSPVTVPDAERAPAASP